MDFLKSLGFSIGFFLIALTIAYLYDKLILKNKRD